MATEGQGSDSIESRIFCAVRTNSTPCAASLSPTNSLTSAPAMKPLDFAERMTRPFGGDAASSFTCLPSSITVSLESTLVDVPGLSKVSQAMPSASTSRDQAVVAGWVMTGKLSYSRLRRHGAANGEVAEDGPMVRPAHVRHLEVRDLDLLADEHEVELQARDARRERGQVPFVGAAQSGGAHEEIDLVRAPEGVEVPGDDHRFVRLDEESVQEPHLFLALAILERQVHEEDAHIVEFELDDEALDAGVEVVEPFALDARCGEEGVALLAHDGHEVVDRGLAVLALVGAVVAQRVGDVFGLVEHAAAHRADIDLDQADDVRVLCLDELGDFIE